MHILLFQGLDFMEGSVFGIALQTSLNRHRHKTGDTFCRYYECKTSFVHGQLKSKIAHNRDTSAAHTRTSYNSKYSTPTPRA